MKHSKIQSSFLFLVLLTFSGCKDIGKGIGPVLLDFLLTKEGMLIFIPTCIVAYFVYLVMKE